jgi:hypothetical protein
VIAQAADRIEVRFIKGPGAGQFAKGRVRGTEVEAAVLEPSNVAFTATIELRNGKAESITWSNGVVITRSTAAAVPDISGTWKSSINVTYNISQNGEQFSWDAPLLNEKGSGRLSGKQVAAKWSGEAGSDEGTGKVIVDANSKAVRIEWNHNVVFFR